MTTPKIEPNELRIGNLVLDNQNRQGEIFIIEPEKVWVKLKTSIGTSAYINDIGQIKPISLTPDWLAKMGFAENLLDKYNPSEGVYYTKEINDKKYCDLSFIDGDKNGIFEVCLFPYTDHFRYQYVHQLQNLFFALCGQELKITI